MTPEKYWDQTWTGRKTEGGVLCNTTKADILLKALWERIDYIDLKKLEIGCGPCLHAIRLGRLYRGWLDDYTGVDMSPKAISIAHSAGVPIRAIVGDATKDQFGLSGVELFIALDSLEHIQDLDALADNLKQLAAPQFRFFGNVPLYRSYHVDNPDIERHMDVDVVRAFIKRLGCPHLKTKIYGVNGYPYMMFEARSDE